MKTDNKINEEQRAAANPPTYAERENDRRFVFYDETGKPHTETRDREQYEFLRRFYPNSTVRVRTANQES